MTAKTSLWNMPSSGKRGFGALGSFGPIVMSGLISACPFLESHGKMRLIMPKEGASEATAINNRGQIVAAGEYRAFLWDKNRLTILGTLSRVPVGNRSGASRINDQGQVVGWSTINQRLSGNFLQHAFLWQTGKMRDLGTLTGDNQSGAAGINRSGQVIGTSSRVVIRQDNLVPIQEHAFVWGNGKMMPLETPIGHSSSANGMNNAGQIVGKVMFLGSTRVEHACLWQRRKFYDLNEMIPKDAGWVLGEATSINDNGVIVGLGLFHGEDHAFLLLPISGTKRASESFVAASP